MDVSVEEKEEKLPKMNRQESVLCKHKPVYIAIVGKPFQGKNVISKSPE